MAEQGADVDEEQTDRTNEVESKARTDYEQVPFEGRAHRDSHPDHLAALATLFGMAPAPPDQCRVLELGCASGDNLIPMAATMPDSIFLGIDIAEHQVARGRIVIDALGLENIALETIGLLELDDDLGTFDYIIAHGVYSWVPAPVREKLMAICGRHLAPFGLAYICYNTYPGWHLRRGIRELLLHHTKEARTPAEILHRSRTFLELFAEAGIRDEIYAAVVRREAANLRGLPDAYVRHDLLESDNHPVYFTQFVKHARSFGLRYLCDAEIPSPPLRAFNPNIAEQLQEASRDRIDLEQYMDHLYNRTFRASILCRETVTLNEVPDSAAVAGLYVLRNGAVETKPIDYDPAARLQFRNNEGRVLGVRDPVSKAALLEVELAWPGTLSYEVLLERVNTRLEREYPDWKDSTSPERDQMVLLETLMTGFLNGVLRLLPRPTFCAIDVEKRPIASPLARLQAASGRPYVTSLVHREVGLSPLALRLLAQLDGTRDRRQLLFLLQRWVDEPMSLEGESTENGHEAHESSENVSTTHESSENVSTAHESSKNVSTTHESTERDLASLLEAHLRRFVRLALLVRPAPAR